MLNIEQHHPKNLLFLKGQLRDQIVTDQLGIIEGFAALEFQRNDVVGLADHI
ncbi:hypothetical protein IBG34_23755 (plasmid) [Aeromonas media]|nr:hypothetical protein IBG34_23755 [Aeromonas media]